jgi:membrane protease YdiL (CAAX protease family)
MKIKEFVITSLFIIASLIVYGIFPSNNTFQQIAATIFFLIILPIFFIKYFLKRDYIYFENIYGDYKKGLLWGFVSLLISILVFYFLYTYFSFFRHYNVPIFITKSFINFIFYEFIIVLPIIILYELYFRGFIMLYYEKFFKYWSNLLQLLIFLSMILILSSDNIYYFLPYLIFAPLAGMITIKSKSFIYSVITQLILIMAIDLMAIKMLG